MISPGDSAVFDEVESKASFDARSQYYRLWMWYVAQAGGAAISGDQSLVARCIRQLFVHTYAFMSSDERSRVEGFLSSAESLLAEASSIERVDSSHRSLAALKRSSAERCLFDAQVSIYESMRGHNMLLPQSSKEEGGLDFSKLLKEGDM
jgi:hypothetical protein